MMYQMIHRQNGKPTAAKTIATMDSVPILFALSRVVGFELWFDKLLEWVLDGWLCAVLSVI